MKNLRIFTSLQNGENPIIKKSIIKSNIFNFYNHLKLNFEQDKAIICST